MAKREHRQLNRKRKIEAFLSLVGIEPVENKRASIDVGELSRDSGNLSDASILSAAGKSSPACNNDVPAKLSREELVQLRARLAEHKKLRKLRSRLYLKGQHFVRSDEGRSSSNTVNISPATRSLSNVELQQLFLFAFEGGCVYQKPQWCVLNNWHCLSQCLCIVVDGIDLREFMTFATDNSFPFTSQEFSSLAECGVRLVPPLPVNIPLDELLHVPKTIVDFNKVQKRMYYDQMLRQTIDKLQAATNSHAEQAAPVNIEDDSVSKTKLLLSAPSMLAEHFPTAIHRQILTTTDVTTVTTKSVLNNNYSGNRSRSISATLGLLSKHVEQASNYVATKESYTPVTDSSPMFAIDCEMCLTTARRNELTRVSLVDESLKVLYDTYVKPHNKIVHYLTQYSGVTASHMVNCTTRLSDVQEKLRELLPSDAILIGHSLNFDLHALNILHPYVIDTSCIFNLTGMQHRKSKLQHLAQVLLNQSIQCGGKMQGHSSVEDARATMELVKLKLSQNSHVFGDTRLGYLYVHPVNETESQMVEPETGPNLDEKKISMTEEKVDVKIEEANGETTITKHTTKRRLSAAEVDDDSVVVEPVKKLADDAMVLARHSTPASAHMLRDWCNPLTSHFVEHKTNASVILQTEYYDHFIKSHRRTLTPTTATDFLQQSSTNKEAVKLARDNLMEKKSFVFVELRALKKTSTVQEGGDEDELNQRRKQLKKIDRCVKQIMETVQDNALVCLVFQSRQEEQSDESVRKLTLDDKLGLAVCKVTNLCGQPQSAETNDN